MRLRLWIALKGLCFVAIGSGKRAGRGSIQARVVSHYNFITVRSQNHSIAWTLFMINTMRKILHHLRRLISLRDLIFALTQREILDKYRGSLLGVLWSFFTPIVMLAIYTFVFSVVFKVRWGTEIGSGVGEKVDFALVLFAGLMPFYFFSEVLNRSPGLVLSHVNYVKKVVFPLEVLPMVAVGTALFQFIVNFLVWLLFRLIVQGWPPVTIFLLPVIMLPFILLVLGLSWLLASLGVYIRDIQQFVGLIVTVSMFLSPLFYPLSALPEAYRGFLYLNPLTYVIEQGRAVMVFGQWPDWGLWLGYFGISLGVAGGGYFWFIKTKKGFADVL